MTSFYKLQAKEKGDRSTLHITKQVINGSGEEKKTVVELLDLKKLKRGKKEIERVCDVTKYFLKIQRGIGRFLRTFYSNLAVWQCLAVCTLSFWTISSSTSLEKTFTQPVYLVFKRHDKA
jgi:hypothetical protein